MQLFPKQQRETFLQKVWRLPNPLYQVIKHGSFLENVFLLALDTGCVRLTFFFFFCSFLPRSTAASWTPDYVTINPHCVRPTSVKLIEGCVCFLHIHCLYNMYREPGSVQCRSCTTFFITGLEMWARRICQCNTTPACQELHRRARSNTLIHKHDNPNQRTAGQPQTTAVKVEALVVAYHGLLGKCRQVHSYLVYEKEEHQKAQYPGLPPHPEHI